ncbi:flavodoxin reductase [Hwangdonia lutea]|uniref:Flavodoxin reductase n=1 Tax=Hwangdonia lutea TaxID=3075823 RepID=A0AA97ERC0_9FLAO|nr:flavodoxin reductase [Hwangdonia sp. SCSIO 19198]WOD44800.1 flavodoxin reductase [Hwangdonia sp. SCSIO 19198]
MKTQIVTIKSISQTTHDVLCITTEKPKELQFKPGQATEVFINKPGWETKGRPFTFTCLPSDDDVEFIIKTYPDHSGVTNKLLKLQTGDELILNDIFGAIAYKGEGTFIAGGAGITPFISILRDLKSKNKLEKNTLIFANKTSKDIILEDELQDMLGNNFINILSEEKTEQYAHGFVTKEFLKKNAVSLNSHFYVCGPPPMMDAVNEQLSALNVDSDKIITEAF